MFFNVNHRLILLEGGLGSDLDNYIADATILAVRGFRSKRWAIRNSSMMVRNLRPLLHSVRVLDCKQNMNWIK